MQLKTIRKIISNKMIEWLDTIDNNQLKLQTKDSLIVTGGCITSLLLDEDVNDFDVYLSDKDTAKALAQYYTQTEQGLYLLDGDDMAGNLKAMGLQETDINNKHIKGIILKNLQPGRIKIAFLNEHGITLRKINDLKNDRSYRGKCFSPNAISLTDKLQIVLRFYGDPAEIHKNYDFVHATNYFTFKDGLVLNQPALESILTKQLRYTGSLYPVTSVMRMKKFVQRGWKITAGEILKILYQISKLDLDNYAILEEQLAGVDVMYFSKLLDEIRKTDAPLTEEFLFNAIDRVFEYDPEEKDEPEQN